MKTPPHDEQSCDQLFRDLLGRLFEAQELDNAAAYELVETYSTAPARAAKRWVRDQGEVESIVQDVWIELLEKHTSTLREMKTPKDLMRWLAHRARCRAIDRWRAKGVESAALEEWHGIPIVEASEPTAIEVAQAAETFRACQASCCGLSLQDAGMLRLRGLLGEGFDLEQIRAFLEMTRGWLLTKEAIGRRLQRAVHKLSTATTRAQKEEDHGERHELGRRRRHLPASDANGATRAGETG